MIVLFRLLLNDNFFLLGLFLLLYLGERRKLKIIICINAVELVGSFIFTCIFKCVSGNIFLYRIKTVVNSLFGKRRKLRINFIVGKLLDHLFHSLAYLYGALGERGKLKIV